MESRQVPKAAALKTQINLNQCHGPEERGSTCGYCHEAKPNPGHAQWGIRSDQMSAGDYQKLMDRGWRRCGTYYYKVDFKNSCCQPYTIRLDTNEYKISDSQKKVMKRFNKFLLGEIGMDGKKVEKEEEIKQPVAMIVDQSQQDTQKRDTLLQVLNEILLTPLFKDVQIGLEERQLLVKQAIISPPRDKHLKDTLSWSSNILIKIYHKYNELIKVDLKFFIEKLRDEVKIVRFEDTGYITFIIEEPKQQLQPKCEPFQKGQKPKIVAPEMEEVKGGIPNDDLNYSQYFKEFVPLPPQSKPLKHRYTVQVTRAMFTEETYKVYLEYQASVHKDGDKSKSSYTRFLCECPLFDPAEPHGQLSDSYQYINR